MNLLILIFNIYLKKLKTTDDDGENFKQATEPKQKKIKKEKKIEISPVDFFAKSPTPKKPSKKSENVTKNNPIKKVGLINMNK